MANQIIIDIGAVANDGTGDPLRTAFGYVNDNFSNVWATGVANANIGFSGNKILTVNTNGNLVLAPNGTGKVVANVDIVPNTANVRNLGALTSRWSTVYSQYLNVSGEVDFTGDVTVGGNLTVEGDTIQIGNITTDTKTIQLANTANTANAANGSGVTVGANDNIATMLYSSTSNTWVMNIGANITGNVTAPYFFGNGSQLTGVSNYANANAVAYGQAGWAGNIIPATSNTYSLGNSTNQWSDLYVSNATIYMNNVPVGLTAGNVLTVDGADVVTTSANGESNVGNLEISGTVVAIAADAPDTLINITPTGPVGGWAFLQLPTNDTANTSNTRLHNSAGNIEFGTGDFSTGSTDYIWTLDNTGNLNLPNNGDLNFAAGGIVQAVDEDFSIRVQDADDDGFALLLQVDDGAGTVLGSTELQRDRYVVQFAGGGAPQFTFNENGEFSVPGNIRTNEYVDSSLYAVSDNVNNGSVELKVISYAGDTLGSNVRVTQSNATISTSNALYTWNFDNTGNLTIPGNLNGSGASPAPSINGFDSVNSITVSASGNVSGGNILTSGLVSVAGNITGGNNLTLTANILGTNSGNPLVIDAGGTTGGYSYVSIPSFTDGGEQLVIKNDYNSSLGIRFETETGNFSLIGNNLSFTDSTTQNTAYPGSATALTLSGNISGGNILGNGASMTGVVTKTTGTWTVTSGTNTYSFTVPANGVYQLWVNGNIPNGIIVYNATVSVSNTNVPVIGQQFAWNYEGAGNPIVFTSIPSQIIGTAGAISNANPSVGTTANTFEFGINNSSGNAVTVNYGYTKIS